MVCKVLWPVAVGVGANAMNDEMKTLAFVNYFLSFTRTSVFQI